MSSATLCTPLTPDMGAARRLAATSSIAGSPWSARTIRAPKLPEPPRTTTRTSACPVKREAEPPLRSGMTLREMARPERFELPTPWFVAKYSIQLSYGRAVKTFEQAEPKRLTKRENSQSVVAASPALAGARMVQQGRFGGLLPRLAQFPATAAGAPFDAED